MTIGFALCGSFCTYHSVFPIMEKLAKEHRVIPIFSFAAASTDSRFGKAQDFLIRAQEICGCTPITTLETAEPIGPQKLLDVLLIAPCTGNTLAKLANGIADTPVTMAAKSHLRNNRPVVLAVSTNDALSSAGQNIGKLLGRKNYFFVPFRQDDPVHKPTSVVADFTQIPAAVEKAAIRQQLQPMLLSPP